MDSIPTHRPPLARARSQRARPADALRACFCLTQCQTLLRRDADVEVFEWFGEIDTWTC
jgi:hypothetical protein